MLYAFNMCHFLEMFCFVRNSFFLGKWISKEIVQKGPEELEKKNDKSKPREVNPPLPPADLSDHTEKQLARSRIKSNTRRKLWSSQICVFYKGSLQRNLVQYSFSVLGIAGIQSISTLF